MTPGPGVEPGPHWWEASALTTASSLLPANKKITPPSQPIKFIVSRDLLNRKRFHALAPVTSALP